MEPQVAREEEGGMIVISKEVEFDAGHRVPNHVSKCRNPHGHRYRVRVKCQGPIVEDAARPDFGMLVDFGDLKRLMTVFIHDPLDHAMVIHKDDTDLWTAMEGHGWKVVNFPYVPTAENMARWCWDQLDDEIRALFGFELSLVEVAVWETPTSVAYYHGVPS
jgi:6-pyruvoyltetrahydropterin/6-carboxytetrahydropterin synthase